MGAAPDRTWSRCDREVRSCEALSRPDYHEEKAALTIQDAHPDVNFFAASSLFRRTAAKSFLSRRLLPQIDASRPFGNGERRRKWPIASHLTTIPSEPAPDRLTSFVNFPHVSRVGGLKNPNTECPRPSKRNRSKSC